MSKENKEAVITDLINRLLSEGFLTVKNDNVTMTKLKVHQIIEEIFKKHGI